MVDSDQSTEQRILTAARKVFVKKGMAGARMQDIADEAGINKALLHYYFRNKEKLFGVIFKEAMSQFVPKVNMIFESEMPLFEKIGTFCREYIERIGENPYLPLFIFNEMNKQPGLFAQKLFGGQVPPVWKMAAQIEQEVKKGTIREISPAQLLMNMLSMCVFPFIAKPLWQTVTGMDDMQFLYLMEQRKTEVPAFIIASIKK
jgi:TetR/AcrR family transcriptional regulator